MKIKPPATVLLALLLSACISSGPMYKSKMEETLSSYGAAIRWGEFERAQDFQPPSKRTRLDLEWLKTIHVSSYDVIYKKQDQGDGIVEQTAKIRYFVENAGVEKSLIDRQTWRYDSDEDKMTLESDIPVFQ